VYRHAFAESHRLSAEPCRGGGCLVSIPIRASQAKISQMVCCCPPPHSERQPECVWSVAIPRNQAPLFIGNDMWGFMTLSHRRRCGTDPLVCGRPPGRPSLGLPLTAYVRDFISSSEERVQGDPRRPRGLPHSPATSRQGAIEWPIDILARSGTAERPGVGFKLIFFPSRFASLITPPAPPNPRRRGLPCVRRARHVPLSGESTGQMSPDGRRAGLPNRADTHP
jgi:hypothetical protein